MTIKILDKNVRLQQCTEQPLTVIPNTICMPKLVPNILKICCCWLNQINHMFCHYLFVTGKILEKLQIWRRATDSLMFEGERNKLKIGAK